MKIKNVVWSGITITVMLLLNGGVAYLLDSEFMEYSFLTGIVIVGISSFLNSKGGIGSNTVRMSSQAQTGIKIEEEKQEFNPSIVFYTAIIYTFIAGIGTVIYYKDYFFN